MKNPAQKEMPKVPGRKRGRPRKSMPDDVKNTGGGLPFFNPYGGSKSKKAPPKKKVPPKKKKESFPSHTPGSIETGGSTFPA